MLTSKKLAVGPICIIWPEVNFKGEPINVAHFPPSIVSATLLHQHASRSSSIVIDIVIVVIVNSSFCNFRFDHIATSLLQMEKKACKLGARTSMIQSYYPTMAVKYCGVSYVHHLGRLHQSGNWRFNPSKGDHQPIIDAECGCPSVLGDVCLCPRGCQMSSWWITICLFIAEIYITIRAITKKTVKTVDSYHQFIFREFNKAMGNYPIQNDDYTILHTIPNRDFPSRKVWQLLTNNQSLNSQIIPNPCANQHSVQFHSFYHSFHGYLDAWINPNLYSRPPEGVPGQWGIIWERGHGLW